MIRAVLPQRGSNPCYHPERGGALTTRPFDQPALTPGLPFKGKHGGWISNGQNPTHRQFDLSVLHRFPKS